MAGIGEVDGPQRTSIRLDKDIHRAAKDLASLRGESFEALVQRAVQREVDLQNARTLSGTHALDLYEAVRKVLEGFREQNAPALGSTGGVLVEALGGSQTWSSLMAYRFLQSAPAAVAIKDTALRIVWCNQLYEELAGKPLSEMKGETSRQLNFVSEDDEKKMKEVIQSGQGVELLETVTTPALFARTMRVQLFPFTDPETKQLYLGDLNFDLSGSFAAPERTIIATDAETMSLCRLFLENCSSAVAIKDWHRRIVWCNKIYLQLTGEAELKDVLSKTAEEIFGLVPQHPITINDQAVLEKKQTLFVVEQLPHRGHRGSLRFPILDALKNVQMIGALSQQFKLTEKDLVLAE